MRKLLLTIVVALVAAPMAAAHVTLNPSEAPADSFSRFAVRVPTERDNPTVKITLQIPDGLTFVGFQPKPGWKRTVTMVKLPAPVTVEGEQVTERIGSVTWSGGKIGPGEFDEFGMSAHVPNEPGTELVFPAIQTYSNGEVVRWIGAADGDDPAPRVTLEAAQAEHGAPAATTASSETETETDESGEDSEDRANLALGLGAAGLVAGLAGLVMGFRRRRQ